ncbi:MAG TPA: serine hydrolase domain-containing protein [Longimicrobium sp.]|nr:serine hydrolase domain-containing protein [Longimicrobium sp.]
MMNIKPALAVAALALAAGCAPSRGPVPSPARFEATLDSLRVAHRIPGLAVGVVRDGEVVLARGFGYADVEARTPVTENTPFNIASVTKPISAVVAMRLVEQGKLDLDRRMTSYADFTEFCADARGAGGIFFSDFHCDTEPLTMRHVLAMAMNGRVGERFLYNPSAYSWASRPMREVTGASFSTLVEKLVFVPAGMTRSARMHRALPLPPEVVADLARPYHADSAGGFARSPHPSPQGDGAAGGVVSTAADLARFDQALDAGLLVSAESRRAMWTAGRSPAGAVLPYGLGWFVGEIGGRRAVWHTGVWDGAYSALYLKLPDERLTLILLANSDGLRWESRLDEAAVERSPFAALFVRHFAR